MNRKLLQYVVHDSLKHDILRGVHDAAGHQGSARTLFLAAERFFWPGMKKDIKLYVKNWQRRVVGKTPEPDAREPLEHIRTSEPMELICIDFWSAEQTSGKVIDVLIVTDRFSKMAHVFPCHTASQQNKLPVAFGMISFAFMDFQREYIRTRVRIFKAKSLKTCLRWLVFKNRTPHHTHTTLWVTV